MGRVHLNRRTEVNTRIFQGAETSNHERQNNFSQHLEKLMDCSNKSEHQLDKDLFYLG